MITLVHIIMGIAVIAGSIALGLVLILLFVAFLTPPWGGGDW